MKNKKAMSIAVVILVFATIFISGLCLVAFSLRKNNLDNLSSTSLGDIYRVESILNYNLRKIVDESFEPGMDKEQFIIKFKESLNEYKSGGNYVIPQLSQIESQLDNAIVENNRVSLPLDLKIEGFVDEDLYVSYKYTKVFEMEVK